MRTVRIGQTSTLLRKRASTSVKSTSGFAERSRAPTQQRRDCVTPELRWGGEAPKQGRATPEHAPDLEQGTGKGGEEESSGKEGHRSG
jgi:hypothetical protein